MKDTILAEDADGEICSMNFTHAINVFIVLIRERIFGSMQKVRIRGVRANDRHRAKGKTQGTR